MEGKQVLPRCDKCDKEFEKLLVCGRCKNAFYCSQKCQTDAWKNHKNICKRPGKVDPEPPPVPAVSTPKPKPKPTAESSSTRKEGQNKDDEADDDAAESFQHFRKELLRLTQETNAKMITLMRDSKGEPATFLPRLVELKDEYERMIRDELHTRQRKLTAEQKAKSQAEDEDQSAAAARLGQELMKEVIMTVLQRGVSGPAAVDQLDLANNHFNAGIVQQRSTKDFALEDGDLDGFEPAVIRVKEHGFVCVEGLLDDELAGVIYAECKEKFWDCRNSGAMRPSTGPMVDGYGCWLPNPPRRGTSPELHHALRVLFGLPHEIARQGYPKQLKVPSMAYLGCLPANGGFERLHVDNEAGPTSSGGRELTIVLFLTPGMEEDDGGAFRAYLADERPGPCPRPAKSDQVECDAEDADAAATAASSFKDYSPEAGRCLIFRSKELWHEVLPAKKLHFALTLFVQCTD
eukprot:gnl/TRDRNA2_/TRDRNA2_191103_c0_seq1.p1 gnl/TRDRNA2_/TRDRNA2_191103_c0~~gnl/TRDRNA2_/TRDRNA2_191103_c0_seq1.p1  ORF type:complete len:472 (+),score=100.39 gnl/TRDRNA2_/TRDRNA2_191103_c0_seq1:33-1418(+)